MFGIHMCIAGTLSPHIPLIISVPVKKEHLDISLHHSSTPIPFSKQTQHDKCKYGIFELVHHLKPQNTQKLTHNKQNLI